MDLRKIHDELLRQAAERPELLSVVGKHAADGCPLCTGAEQIDTATLETSNKLEGGAVVSDTYTEEEMKAEVAKAVAVLEAQIADLRTSQAEENLKAEVAKAVEAKETEIAELRAQLDSAVLEGEKAKKELTDLVTLLEEARVEAERQQEAAARMEDRLAKVREVASFPEEYMVANAERWASMNDDSFAGLLADYAAVSAKPTETIIPVETAMQSERVTAPANDRLSATKTILTSALRGVDFSTL